MASDYSVDAPIAVQQRVGSDRDAWWLGPHAPRLALQRSARLKAMRWAFLVLVCCTLFGTAAAAPDGRAAQSPDATPSSGLPDISCRFAVHDGFDRLVVTLPEGSAPVTHQNGSTVSLRLERAGRIRTDARLGVRLRALTGGIGQAELTLAAGVRVRVWRMDNRLVIDALDAPRSAPAQPAQAARPHVGPAATRAEQGFAAVPSAAPARMGNAPRNLAEREPRMGSIRNLPATVPAGRVASAPTMVEASRPVPVASPPPSAAAAPSTPNEAGAAVLLLPQTSGLPGPSILLPFGRDVAGAAFIRAGEGHAVFDSARPLDLSALKDDPVFGGAIEQVLPEGLHLRLHLPPAAQLRLSRRDGGWALTVLQGQPPGTLPLASMPLRSIAGILSIEASQPGHVVMLDDEPTGGRLLVGTQRVSGERVAADHRSAEFALLQTWQGVVVEPLSDRLLLRATRSGFDLSASGPQPLSLASSDLPNGRWPDGQAMTRMFDFPNLSADRLQRREKQALRDAAHAPKAARFAPQIAVASAMLALGLDTEAAAVLHAAVADDPTHDDDPVAGGLAAIASWLSAASGAAAPAVPSFDLTKLGGSDEAALWRALLQQNKPDSATQAANLAMAWPLVLDYPPNLRRPMLRPVAAMLEEGGQDKALDAFLAACPDPSLDLFRARLLQHRGKTDEALALLDRVAGRSDRLARAEALEQGVELRLALKRLDPAAAAASLDRQIYAWRGGDRELRLRQRVAQLRAQAGSWRAALAMLRDTEVAFPEAAAQLHAAQAGIVSDLLKGEGAAKLNALDLVALADEAANLLTGADVEGSLAPALVDKLLALDLPDRAEPILRRLFERNGDAAVKAELGVRLARLIGDGGDANAALAVLDTSADSGLAPMLVSRRGLLRGRLLAESGRPAEALRALSAEDGAEANELKATISEQQHDWASAVALLAASIRDENFARLPETAQRKTVLRLARDEDAAGDTAGLRRLRDLERARFASGEGAELFAVLTNDPVQTASDLSRSATELSDMRKLPARLARAQSF